MKDSLLRCIQNIVVYMYKITLEQDPDRQVFPISQVKISPWFSIANSSTALTTNTVSDNNIDNEMFSNIEWGKIIIHQMYTLQCAI